MEILQPTQSAQPEFSARLNMSDAAAKEPEMDMLVDVQPDEVEFLQTFEHSKDAHAVAYKVKVRGKECIMKVVSKIPNAD